MAKAQKSLQTANERRDIKKATSFSAPATAVACQPKEDPEEYDGGGDRDDSLRIIENLQPGPHEFKPPQDDPHFDQMEPYSRIRLKCAILFFSSHSKQS